MSVKGTNGLGEIFLFLLHAIEDSIIQNKKYSKNRIIEWTNDPDCIGDTLDLRNFFEKDNFSLINNERPEIKKNDNESFFIGKWARSKEVKIASNINLSPKLAYVAGLYLAEGTDHDKMIKMYISKVSSFNFSFTSTEDNSLNLVLSIIRKIIKENEIISTWKVKVGSQYFTELSTISNKLNVPMLRGGDKGQGKLRTIELSLAIKNWAIRVCPSMKKYENSFSHLEPTGSGVARIDFSSRSYYCKWLFPVFMYTLFSKIVEDPKNFT